MDRGFVTCLLHYLVAPEKISVEELSCGGIFLDAGVDERGEGELFVKSNTQLFSSAFLGDP